MLSVTTEKLPNLTMQTNVQIARYYYYFTSHIETCRALHAGSKRVN